MPLLSVLFMLHGMMFSLSLMFYHSSKQKEEKTALVDSRCQNMCDTCV